MDFIFDAFSAWNSFGLFLIAFVFISIGGSIVSYELSWRVKGRRLKARIKEIRVIGKRKGGDDAIRTYRGGIPEKKSEKDKKPLGQELKENPVGGVFGLLFALMFLGIPLFFTGMGAHMGYQYYNLTHHGEYANARVIRNDSHYDSESGTSYKAVLEFHDYSGRLHEVKDSISYGNSPSFKTGQSVGVYYDAEDPKTFVIDDFWHNMALALIMMCVFPFFLGFLMFVSKMQKRQRGEYTKGEKRGAAKYAGETYHTVYEYQLPNGERTEYVSGWSSNMIGKNVPGREVAVFVSARNPEKMKKPSIAAMIFGLIFLLPGLFVGTQAVQTFEFNVFTVLVPIAVIGFIVFKISRFIAKIPKQELKRGMDEFRKKGFSVSSSSAGENARALTTSEVRARMKAYVKNYKFGAYACFLIAAALAGGAYYTGNDMVEKLAVGVPARGEVVDFESRYSSTSDGSGYTYYSVVKYRDASGRVVKFQDQVGSSHRMHKRGDEVDVLYNPDDSSDAMIDRGIWNWLVSGGLALVAFLMSLAGLDNMRTVRLYGGGRQRV